MSTNPLIRGRCASTAGKAATSLALIFAGVAAGALLAEVALRLVGADRGGVFTAGTLQFRRIPGIFDPGQDALVRTIPELRHQVRIDSLGYRGNDFPRRKAAGEFRIIFLGDSFVFGDYVEDTVSLPAQLETELSNRCTEPVRVINAGIGGSTIRDQFHMMDRAMVLEPDLVILQFSENDVSDLAGPPLWEDLERNRNAKARFPLSLAYPHVRGTALWNLALRARSALRSDRAARALQRPSSYPRPVGEAQGINSHRERYAESLEHFRDSLDARGLPFVYAVFPSHLSVYGLRESDQLDWLDSVIRTLELRSVSFLPALAEDGRSQEELYLLPHDGHASGEGYRIAAHALADSLVKGGALRARCDRPQG